MKRYLWLFVALAGTGCAAQKCEISYRGCCLTEKPKELKLTGETCWPKGEFILNAGEITGLIDKAYAQEEAIATEQKATIQKAQAKSFKAQSVGAPVIVAPGLKPQIKGHKRCAVCAWEPEE